MAVRSSADILRAFDEGRWHSQRFIKTATSQAGDSRWQDWSFTAGQPAYDARIGDALACTPMVASRNDAIWFPAIDPSMDRHLVGMRFFANPNGIDQLSVECQAYDLLAVYPLIDGDTTDPQDMDNTLALPRYADGAGVRAVLVNHVAPATAQATFVITYTDYQGNSKTMTGITTTSGVNQVAWTLAGTVTGPLYLPLAAGSNGVRSIDSVTFNATPGGLWCIYLVKPLEFIATRPFPATGGQLAALTEKCFCAESAFRLPRIYDGAWLGLFYMPQGGSRAVTVFGSMTFIWN